MIISHFIDAPMVSRANSSSHVLILNQMMRFLCYYTGIPSPTIQWQHNGTDIGLARPGDGRNFTIQDVYMYDSTQQGTYTCRVTNSLGVAEASYSVRLGNISAILISLCIYVEMEYIYLAI